MSKSARRFISLLTIILMLIPQVAMAAPITKEIVVIGNFEVPLGEKQIEYIMYPNASGSSNGSIVRVSMQPTQSGNEVYPKCEITIQGSAVLLARVELQSAIGGVWREGPAQSVIASVTNTLSYSPHFVAQRNTTYRFVVYITSTPGGGVPSSSYTMNGNSFYIN